MNDHMTKPITLDAVVAIVNQWGTAGNTARNAG